MSQVSEDPRDRREARRARRRARRVVFDTSIPSPCIKVCQIDRATDCCLGCFRAIDEIRDWPILSAAQKTAVLARSAERRAGARLEAPPGGEPGPAR